MGGPVEYFEKWTPQYIITGHSSLFWTLWLQGIEQIPQNIGFTFMWAGIMSALYFLNIIRVHTVTKAVWYLFIIFFLGIMLITLRIYNLNLHRHYIDLFYFSLLLIPAIALIKSKDVKFNLLFSLILLTFAMTSIAGSDCGLRKVFSLPLFPLALSILFSYNFKTIKQLYLLASLSLAMIAVPFLL